jgi:hypothetical protein
MAQYRLVERLAFEVLGKKTWISGQDNELFGRFWDQCTGSGLFKQFEALRRFHLTGRKGPGLPRIFLHDRHRETWGCAGKRPGDLPGTGCAVGRLRMPGENARCAGRIRNLCLRSLATGFRIRACSCARDGSLSAGAGWAGSLLRVLAADRKKITCIKSG